MLAQINRLISIAACSVLCGCSHQLSLRERMTRAAGCYRLQLEVPFAEPFIGFTPAGFRLDTVPRARLDTVSHRSLTGFHLEPSNPRLTYMVGLPYWDVLGEDSILIEWGSGLGGVEMRLQLGSDSLRGTAQGFTDVADAPEPRTRALALRVPCPEEPIEWVDAR